MDRIPMSYKKENYFYFTRVRNKDVMDNKTIQTLMGVARWMGLEKLCKGKFLFTLFEVKEMM